MTAKIVGPIKAKFVSSCMTCEEPVYIGEDIMWLPGQGSWHAKCPQPRSIKMYLAEQAKKGDR